MFKTILTKSALKDFKKLEVEVQKQIKNKLTLYQSNPLDHATKLTNYEIGTYRFRIGNYRAIFDLEDDKIIIMKIGHRKEIYK